MKELNINYLRDGDLVIYNDRDVEFKHRSMSAFSNPRLIPMRTRYTYTLKPMEYKHGGFECFVVKHDEYYLVKTYCDHSGVEQQSQEYILLPKDVEREIEVLEQAWSTEAITKYVIYQENERGDMTKVSNQEIYNGIKIPEVI